MLSSGYTRWKSCVWGRWEGEGEIVSYAMWNFFVMPEEEGAAEEGVGGDRRRDEGRAYYASWPPDAHYGALKALVEMGRKKGGYHGKEEVCL